MSKIDEIKQALAAATPEWFDNGNEIVSKQNPKVGIGGFLKEEDNHLAANAPEYIAYLLKKLEEKEIFLTGRQYTINRLKEQNEEIATMGIRQGEQITRLLQSEKKQAKKLEEARFALEEIAEHGGVNLRGASCAEIARTYFAQEGEGNQE
ncbi:hypothetical protein [Paenibacillus sp. ACRRY]|uniref:hypothetical protein n=1 Tax=Paenibacillus sp. ACRRY TaxID=2918208 RepID=UPI001EF720E8|nr:hypothetical protein [Paenibacillus sp. ACRRY]MCG7385075.1 hypothetical protein [Paenibacillus sp. ACRRY]